LNGPKETWWRFEHWFKLMGIIVGAMLLVEGILSIAYIAPYTEEIGGFLQTIMIPFGAHLVIIGLFIILYWLMRGTNLPGAKLADNRWISLLVLLAGLLLVLESFGLTYYVSTQYSAPGYVRGFWIAAAAAQLFFIGMMVAFGWLSKNMDQVKTGWARIMAYIFSSLIAAQGLWVIGAAVPVEIEGIGGVMASTVSLFGLQLFILGLVTAAIWGFKDKVLFGRKLFSHWFILDLALLLAEIIAIEGLILIAFAAPINPDIPGIGELGKWVVVVAGSQLFLLATVCVISWFWIEKRAWQSKPVSVLGVMIGAVLATEGIFIMGVAAPIVVESIGGMLASTVTLAGIQLLVIGLILVAFWLLKDRTVFGRDLTSNRIISLGPVILGAVVTVEGLILVAYASPVELDGVGGMRAAWMTLAGIQLFLMGGATCMFWYWRDRKSSEASLTRIAEPSIAWILASEGLFIMGIAASTWIDGIGTILQRTVAIAGAQLFVLALIVIGLRSLRGKGILNTEIMGIRLTELLTYIVFAVITIEGLAMMVLSANIYIDGFGGVSGIYIAAAGAQLSLLALLGMSFCVWRNGDINHLRSQYLAMGALFLLLLVPPAFLF